MKSRSYRRGGRFVGRDAVHGDGDEGVVDVLLGDLVCHFVVLVGIWMEGWTWGFRERGESENME